MEIDACQNNRAFGIVPSKLTKPIYSSFLRVEPENVPVDQPGLLREEYYPGDIGFDPLGLRPEDPEEFDIMATKELQNGRLAMLAAAGKNFLFAFVIFRWLLWSCHSCIHSKLLAKRLHGSGTCQPERNPWDPSGLPVVFVLSIIGMRIFYTETLRCQSH